MRSNSFLISATVVSFSLLSGCTTFNPRETVFNPDAPRMSAIYSQAAERPMQTSSHVVISPNPNPGREALEGYTRDAQDEVKQLFPRVPNPSLVMYVFPHIASGDVPIPGFSTAFELYERQNYALPGEILP